MEERLIELFKEYLPAWSWEEWQAAGASDKEDIVINALADFGPDMPIAVDEAYDLFWDWVAGITEADFSRKITESTTEDPYGYGPYKTFSDPNLEVGDYVLTTRPLSAGGRTYPARITSITSKWIEYEISGFGFTDRGTKARPGSANDKALRNARTYIQNIGEELTEAKRIISNPDILYHATEAENLYKILSEDTLKGSINTRANINAVCLTTDRNYTIFHYPCKLQFSRELLAEGGYEFIPYDEFANDTEGRGESEERVLGDITEVSKYLTAVHLNWDQIAIAKSIQPGAEGNYISCPRYAKHTNDEGEAWELRYEDFIEALKKLQASGVYIFQEGRKTYRYWIDENGKPHAGRMPATIPTAETGEFKYGREPAFV